MSMLKQKGAKSLRTHGALWGLGIMEKENGNYYIISWVYIGQYIGIMENKMATTIIDFGVWSADVWAWRSSFQVRC